MCCHVWLSVSVCYRNLVTLVVTRKTHFKPMSLMNAQIIELHQTAAVAVAPAPVKARPARASRTKNLVSRGGWWYFKKIHRHVDGRKERVFVSLETKDLDLARAKRDEQLRRLVNGDLAALKGPRAATPATVGEVLSVYGTKINTVNESLEHDTMLKNCSACRTFLRWAHGAKGKKNEVMDPDNLSMAVFADDMVVAKFKANYVAAAGEDRMAREARRRGAGSILRQVKSMFSKQAMLLYRDLHLPDMTAFRAQASMDAEDRVHAPISQGTLAAMWEAMEKVKETQPALYLVHAMHKFLGLRNDEIRHARVDWFKRAPWGQVFFSVLRTEEWEPKRSQGHIPLTAEVAALFAPFVKDKQAKDYLVPAKHATEREDLVDKVHAAWIRGFLPAGDYAKAGYELRRWAAQTMEAKYGREASKAFLRHTPQGVAERHYFEHWYPWRRLGTDIGITLEEAKGKAQTAVEDAWTEGASALMPAK